MVIRLVIFLFLLLYCLLFISFSANPPQGNTGAPGEPTCATTSCHSGNNILINGQVTIEGLPSNISPGEIYPLTVRLMQTSGTPFRAGFQMAIIGDENGSAGTFFNPGSSSTVSDFNERQYFEHQPAKSFTDNGSEVSYTVDWASPSASSFNNVVLYLAANFTNGNANRTGDRIIVFRDTLHLISSDPLSAMPLIIEKGCYSGEATHLSVRITGGTPPYQTQWDTFGQADTLYFVAPGEYAGLVSDALGDTIRVRTVIDSAILPVLNLPDTIKVFAGITDIDLTTAIPFSCPDIFSRQLSQNTLECNEYPGKEIQVVISDMQNRSVSSAVYVSILDTLPPEIFCIEDFLRISTCAPFSYGRPQSSDNCSTAEVTLIEGLGVNSSFPPDTTYEIYQAKDLAGNTRRCTVTVVNNPTVDLDINVTDISCFGSLDGRADVLVTGPNPPYRSGLTGDLLVPVNLGPGSYELVILDDSGCRFDRTFIIEEPDLLQIEDIEVSQPQTMTSGDGEIKPVIAGGSPPYQFRWYTEDELFSTDEELELLFPGIYLMEVTDNNGCQAVSDSILVENTTGIFEGDESDPVHIYPVPVKDWLYLAMDDGLKNIQQIELIFPDGHIEDILTISDKLDLSDLFSGIYFLRVRHHQTQIVIKKLIKLP